MSVLREILAALLLVGGAAVVALAALGVARLPEPFSRMHAAAKAGVAGAGLLLLGAGLAFGTAATMLTVLAAVAFLLLTAPVASHALGRAAYVAGAPAPAPVALRRIVCCLVGRPHQAEATAQAFDLAGRAGGSLTGLSGAGLEPRMWRGPLPVGGAFWANWLTSRSRQRIRGNCAAALEDFQGRAAATPRVEVAARHEEGQAADLVRTLAGHDLVVLPAGMGPHGGDCAPGEEIAASLARTRLVPVLRVRRKVAEVRSVVILVGSSPACGMLAAGLLRSGMWPNAELSIRPIADYRAGVAAAVEAQAELLRAAGRKVRLLPSLELEFELQDVRPRLAAFDAAVLSCLSTHHGGFLDMVRHCAHEAVADTAPVVLLP